MRMGSLEDALAIIHSSKFDRPLLLSDDTEEEEARLLKAASEEQPLPLTDALGTLCLDAQGGSCFYGPSGGSEVCSFAWFLVYNLN